MTAVSADDYPREDADVAGFVRGLGLPGLVDVHVHFLPGRLQEAVWRYFDRLDDPPWPVAYRDGEQARLATLRDLGVVAHTALAYAHKPGMLGWLNGHTLDLAEREPQVIPTFTMHPEDGVDDAVAGAIARGGALAKVHLQVGRFHATDPRLDPAWERLAHHRIPVVVHASAVYGVDGGGEYCGADAIRALLERHPDVRVIVAHLGAPDVGDFLRLAEQVPALRLDTAMVPTDPPYFAALTPDLRQRAASHWRQLVFGSDFPTIPHRYAAQVRGLARLELDASQLRGVLHDHAVALLPDGTLTDTAR